MAFKSNCSLKEKALMHAKSMTFIALIASTFVLGHNVANAHPHVFAEAHLDLISTDEGTIQELNHVWRFDELFTSTVILEFDQDQNGELDGPELDTVANTIARSTADFNYFQNIGVKGKDIALEKVTEMAISIEEGQLIVAFATIPAETVRLSDDPQIGIYDPTFYTAIEFFDDKDMVLVNAPAGCTSKMVIPDADEAIAQNSQNLTDAFYDTTTPNDLGKILATRMEISCK